MPLASLQRSSRSAALGTLAASAALGAYTWFRYRHCLFGFFYLDDFWLIRRAGGIQVDSLAGFAEIFEPTHTGFLLYRPLTQVGYFVFLRQLFGYDATAYHALQLLVFVANALLVLALARRLTGSNVAGLATAALYVAAPGHAAAVYWMAAFSMTGTTWVVLTTMWWWLREDSTWRPLGCALLQVVALLASEHAVVLPALLACLSLFSKPRDPWRRVARDLAMPTALVAAYSVAKLYYLASVGPPRAYALHLDPAGWLERIGRFASACFDTPGLLLPPLALGALVLGLAALASWCALRGHSRWRLLALGCAVFLVSLAPVLPLRDHYYDYFVGVAGMGAALAAVGACHLAGRRWRETAALLATMVVALDLSSGADGWRSNLYGLQVVEEANLNARWLLAVEGAALGSDGVRVILVPHAPGTASLSRHQADRYLLNPPQVPIEFYPTGTRPDPAPGRIVLVEPPPIAEGDRLPGWDPRWDWLRRAAGGRARAAGSR